MKIATVSLTQISPGKHNVKDARLDQVEAITNSKKKTYLQVEVVSEDLAAEADAIVVPVGASTDLILKDLEFVEGRLSRASEESEKNLLLKIKSALEKEELVLNIALSEDERKSILQYGLLTNKTVICVTPDELEDINGLLARAIKESGYISFFTTGEKETRAWLIKKGATAWEAAGAVHSDIQRGFIRAEIISLNDFISYGGENAAKQAGKLCLEQKDYLMQDADLTMFRFNK
jgi:ribosome-binding ATPase YchF (GTP1/OBG family)